MPFRLSEVLRAASTIGAQYGACECTELGLIARRKVRAVSCPSGAEDVCGG